MRKLEGRISPERGQSLLEVALLTPVILALLVGIIDFGRYAYMGILVENAARAGAAYGAQGRNESADTAGIQAAADNDFANGQSLTGLGVTSFTSCGCDSGGTVTLQGQTTVACTTAGNPKLDTSCAGGVQGHYVVMVSVTASGKFNALFNFPGIPKSLTVTRTATMRVAD
jgi:Flp pilus assembly protein TadG